VLQNSALVRLQKKAKSAVRAILRVVVSSDVCWRVLNRTLVPVAEFARSHRSVLERSKMVEGIVGEMMPDLRVANGPFQGMQYPELRYFGGELFPKFIGSFERELHGIVEEICETGYSEVVNIGCAEGHYLVGLGMRLPRARLYGFDIDPVVRDFCGRMAELNGVADRLQLGGFCDAAALTRLPLRRALILSDCEGYEAELFSAETAAKLAAHDILIEVHDNFDIEISSKLLPAFSATHAVERISSLDDIAKAREYDYPELRGYNLQQRKDLLMEGRSAIMEWFFCRSLTMARPMAGERQAERVPA
jgi:hypothetical protein